MVVCLLVVWHYRTTRHTIRRLGRAFNVLLVQQGKGETHRAMRL